MSSLVTRFHLLIFGVTIAIAGVALARVPADYAFAAHWRGMAADWLWPRDPALAVAPLLQLAGMAAFFWLGRALGPERLARRRHILEPALTVLLAVAAGCQMGLLLLGIGSDFDLFRLTGFGLAAVLLATGAVLFEAERDAYGGLRLPWSIAGDRRWRAVHRVAGAIFALNGLVLGWFAWSDPGPGPLALAMAASLLVPPLLAGLVTLVWRRAG